MTTLGTSTWGVVLSTGVGATPSGDIIYFLCDDISRQLTTKDTTNHYASQTSVTIALGQLYYKLTFARAVYNAKTIASMNSHMALLQVWMKNQTKIYAWVKDTAGTYMDFIIGTTNTDYLPCCIKDITDKLSHAKFTVDIRLEETA